MRILALTKYGDAAASTRQRFLQYRPALNQAGFQLQVSPLLDNRHIHGLTVGRPANVLTVGMSYARRLSLLMADPWHADVLWVHYELFPYLPAAFERLAFWSGIPVVLDYDDAIFHMYESIPLLRGKLRSLIARARAVTAGNDYLAEYALRWNSNVQVIPTVVDTCRYMPMRRSQNAVPVIGWIGSSSTWSYIRPLLPMLESLCRAGRAQFLAVGGGMEAERDRFSGMELRDWAEDREIADVQAMDIGIMPLPDEPWARGKCGYKLIQYMACGLPTVASPVGVNREIVLPGKTGVLAANLVEWEPALALLLGDPARRQSMGEAGRERATALYSLAAQAPRIVDVMQSAIQQD